jgi:pyridoxamine 5'-phosphate oxidase
MSNLASLRKNYERAELDESASHSDPLQQFDQWFKEALHASWTVLDGRATSHF